MKKTILSLLVALATVINVQAQTFEWGTATWNIQDGRVYESVEELNAEGVVLTFPNPTGYTLTFLNVILVEYNLYIDDATEPIKTKSSAKMSNAVPINYEFVEGHSYKIVTTRNLLAQANLATYTTDTLSTNDDSYTISFKINGPELQNTYNVEADMSLSIIDQNWSPTISAVDVAAICKVLGVESIDKCDVYGLNLNGSYNNLYISLYDGWRDADGEFTTYYGGWDSGHGHNAYPAVYCIKLNEAMDSVYYYFYDYWKEYDPNAGTETGGGTIVTSKHRAPTTSYHNMIWDWTNEDGSVTQYSRKWRCDEGSDYKASWAFIANKKMVRLNATMHFLSQEEYDKKKAEEEASISLTSNNNATPVAIYNINGTRQSSIKNGLNIVKYSDGSIKKVMK